MPPESRTVRAVVRELIEHPFFPILFIGEAVKQWVQGGPVLEFAALAAGATLLWALSDAVDVREDIVGFDGGREGGE